AKQPTANYMVPAYALGGLGIVLTQRCVAGLGLGGAGVKRAGRALFVVLVAALVGAQGWGLVKLDRDQRDKRAVALSVDNDVFAACARIYAFPPSSASFALYRGSWEGGLAFRDAVDAHVPDNDYWFNQNTMELRDAHRAVDVAQVAAGAPCVMVRGAHRGPILTHLREKVPDLAFTSHCDTRDEMIIAAGISCDGILSTK
ncbi:MAG: hypothetical protein KDE22_03685, partial [Rhodobacterales bacterium]|nr:hypothetical protein [Rhodobacterales bacterium]